MASEMLEKILEAEKVSKEKQNETEKNAASLVADAELKAKKIVDEAVAKALEEKKSRLSECSAKAEKVIEEKSAEAKEAALKMSDLAETRMKECTDIIINKIIV